MGNGMAGFINHFMVRKILGKVLKRRWKCGSWGVKGVSLFLFLWLWMVPFSDAGAKEYKFRNVMSFNKLSHFSVQCIIQDSLGFIWIGTNDGLNLFDGYEYRYYRYDPHDNNSISNNDICCLEIQNNTYLWIGTRGGGVNRMNLLTGKITRFIDKSFDGLVRDVFVDQHNTVWIATVKGLMKYVEDQSVEGGHFVNVSQQAVYRRVNNIAFTATQRNTAIQVINQVSPDKLLVGADTGVFEYDIKTGEFKELIPDIDEVTTCIMSDKKGNIWISSFNGVVKLTKASGADAYHPTYYNTKAEPQYRLPADRVQAVQEDQDGNIWFGSRGGGLTLIKNDIVVPINAKYIDGATKLDNLINALFIDRNGILWIGQENYGLKIVDLLGDKFKTYLGDNQNDGNQYLVSAITGKGDNIWAGTVSSGIDVFKYEGGKLLHINTIALDFIDNQGGNKEVVSLLRDKDDNLWIGASTNSVWRYSEKKGISKYPVNGYVQTLMEDNMDNIWFGTWRQGIGYVNKRTGVVEQYNTNPSRMLGLSNDLVFSLKLDSQGLLWVGTKGGGLNVAPVKDVMARQGRFVIYRHQPSDSTSISYDDVQDIIETKDGQIWVATGRGINQLCVPQGKNRNAAILDGTAFFKTVTQDNGLPGNMVYSIREDNDGYLWLGTNNGLCRFSPKDNSVIVYDENDGLPSSYFKKNAAFVNPNNGLVCFGGLNGLVFFKPRNIVQDAFKPTVRMTSFRLNNQLIEPGQEQAGRIPLEQNISYTHHLELSHSQNDITFEFSALNYSFSNNLRYAYRLLGYSDKWIETDSKNRRLTYTNLNAGHYTLQIKATDSDGSWTKQSADIDIDILPPFWLTSWAYLIYVIFTLALLFLFRKYSIIRINEKNKLQIERLEQNKRSEIFEAKFRFFTNVSHEIRTPLTLINEPLQQLLSRQDLSAEAQETAHMVRRNLKRLLNQVNQLLEFRKMESDKYVLKYSSFKIDEVLKSIVADFDVVVKNKNIEVEILCDNEIVVNADRQLIDTILFNLVSNSLKFLPANGKLCLEAVTHANDARVDIGFFKILVADNGPGIPEYDVAHVFDRFFQSQNNSNNHLGGTGIGLSIVKEYVEQHNGIVDVCNLPDGGCCFQVVIPISGTAFSNVSPNETTLLIDDEKEIAMNDDKLQQVDNSMVNHTMVLVEDDVDLAIYIKGIFEGQFKVIHFDDGKEALARIGEVSPDIMICDLMLPGMNGLALTARLKENQETSHIPIIMLTAMSEDEAMAKGLGLGADSYLTKPFNTAVLKAQVGSILRSRELFRARFSKRLVLEPALENIVPQDEKFIRKIMEVTERRMSEFTFEVGDIVDEMGMSHTLLLKKFKALTGMSLVEFIRSMRIKKAVQLFQQDKFSIADVAYKVGFSDPKYFSKCFANEMGLKPSDFVKQCHDLN
jgi:signal transduction histidine kinase/ligand-binding sensor domain-containing protein/DNA-binding response OmpR family regulator